MSAPSYQSLSAALEPVGKRPGGGYERAAWTGADLDCRAWFTDAAQSRGLQVERDRNGNLWAWWLPAGGAEPSDAFVTGSHLDSVVGGGAYDGPLGIVSAFAAIDALRESGLEPRKPVGVVAFSDEEGARFGVACVGSSLLTGRLDPDRARSLRDGDGITLAQAMSAAGCDPAGLGKDVASLHRIGMFVELHIEQGRGLVQRDAPIGIGTSIWPHGRWELRIEGEGNHAGTTQLADRHDPMITLASIVLSARAQASTFQSLATIGRVSIEPNTSNAVAASVDAWLDARSADEQTLAALVDAIDRSARDHAAAEGTSISMTRASLTPAVVFAGAAREHLLRTLGPLPELATGAGHDAGILAGHVPAAMLFVRNPSGVSHAPAEYAAEADALAGVDALAAAMASWIE